MTGRAQLGPAMLLLLNWAVLGCAAETEGIPQACEAPPDDAVYASTPNCYFPSNTPIAVPVKAIRTATHNSRVITFGLPDGVSLGLPVSACIMIEAPGLGKKGKPLYRPYNPISSNERLGEFELLVKEYDEGTVSKFAAGLQKGDMVKFKQLKGNVKKWRYPFGKESITMVAGGTGIAPMIQALHPLLGTPGDATKVRLLYGNLAPDVIMLKPELDALAAAHPNRLEITYVVGASADDTSAGPDWSTGNREHGWIDAAKIRRLAFPPAEGTVVWVCGQPGMYDDLAGSRMKPLTADSVLAKLGYTDEMVWRS